MSFLKNIVSILIIVLAIFILYTSFAPENSDPISAKPAIQARLGMNLSGPSDSNTEYPFVNVFLLSRSWISNCHNLQWGKGPELIKDENEWIKELEPNCLAETLVFTDNKGHAPFGDYTCLYEGDGELNIKSSTIIPPLEQGRLMANIHSHESTFIQLLKTNPDNYLRNIRLIMPEHESTYQTHPFYPPFLEHWKNFDTFRFMDWMLTNNSKIVSWDERPKPNNGTYTLKGVPLEVMIELCNTQRINPWFCMPHLADNDYIKQFAQVVKNSLDPTLKVYIEYSNEIWNNIFEQQHYAEKRAKELKIGPPDRPWEGAGMFYGHRSQQIFKIWEDIFEGRSQLVRVIAWQAAAGSYWTDTIVLGNNNTGKNADVLAIAPYISLNVGPDTNPNVDTVANWSVDQVLDYVETVSLPESIKWIETQKKVADKYGLKLVCYEAGQHLVGIAGGENNETLTQLFMEANRHHRMGEIYTKYMNAWEEKGGDLMCIFASTSAWSKWGCWGLTEYMDETEYDQPKYKAVMEWNQKHLYQR